MMFSDVKTVFSVWIGKSRSVVETPWETDEAKPCSTTCKAELLQPKNQQFGDLVKGEVERKKYP